MRCLLMCVLLVGADDVRAGSDSERQKEFYTPDVVQSVELKISDENWQRMLNALPQRVYVPASFRWKDIVVENVAIRFKGNSSSAPPQARHKRSFLVRFDKYDKTGRFLGLRRVSFDNAIQFGSLFSEPLVTEILRDLDIPVHRANHARLTINGEYRGVYVNVERIDQEFVQHRLSDPDGSLFKVDEGGPGCNLQYPGDDSSIYHRTFEPKTKAAKKSNAALVEFIRHINRTPADQFNTMLPARLEHEDLLKVIAVMAFAGAFDQLTGWNPHNYYLHQNSRTGRWRYLPWDLDVGFCATAFGRIRVLEEWHAGWPVSPGTQPSPLLDGIAGNAELLAAYRKVAGEILEAHFRPDQLSRKLDETFARLRPHLRDDPFPRRRVTNPTDRDYVGIVNSMKQFMHVRYELAKQQLANPGPRPESKSAPGTQMPPELARRLRMLEQRAHRMRQQGKDIRPIQRLIQRFAPLVRDGRIDDAREVLDEALRATGASPDRTR